jgi:hypothetical protein
MPRKTFSVEKFKLDTNKILASDECANMYVANEGALIAYFECLCTRLERILLDTGNYEGFQFLDNNDSNINTVGYFKRRYS